MSIISRLIGGKCERCGHRNPQGAEFCGHCGVSRAFTRPTILKGNRWDALDDEVAAYFRFSDLKGLCSTSFYVPTGMRAVVLRTEQGNDYQTLESGWHAADDLFSKLNNFMRSSHGEVLVFREDPQALQFSFQDILSAELLSLHARLTVQLKISNPHVFLRRAMLREGAVTQEMLHVLLSDGVRQALAETLGRRHIEYMVRDDQLRERVRIELDERLRPLLDEQGLALQSLSELGVSHERFDQQRALQGRLWLIEQENKLQDEHARRLDELYNDRELQAIHQQEADLRRRQRLGQLRGEEAQLAQVLRMLEVDQFDNITKARSREEAIRLGAKDQLEALESQHRHAQMDRERTMGLRLAQETSADEAWQHTQALARIRHDTEKEVERIGAAERASLARARANNALDELQLKQSLARTATIEQEEERKRLAAAHLDVQLAVQRREQELKNADHKVQMEDLGLQQALRQREALRVQAYEDALTDKKVREVEVEARKRESEQGLSELEQLSGLNLRRRAEKMRQYIDAQKAKTELEERQLDTALSRELERKAQDAASELQRRAADTEYLRVLGTLPEHALIAQADNDTKIAALVQLMKLRTYDGMSEQQIRATEGGAAVSGAATSTPSFASTVPPAPAGKTVADVHEDYGRKAEERYDKFIATLTDQQEKAGANLLRAIELLKWGNQASGQPPQAMPYPQPYAQPHHQQPYPHPGYGPAGYPPPQPGYGAPMGAQPGLYQYPAGHGVPPAASVHTTTQVFTGGAVPPGAATGGPEVIRTVALKHCLNPTCKAENLASAPRCSYCNTPF
jgi:hypothetical protein